MIHIIFCEVCDLGIVYQMDLPWSDVQLHVQRAVTVYGGEWHGWCIAEWVVGGCSWD